MSDDGLREDWLRGEGGREGRGGEGGDGGYVGEEKGCFKLMNSLVT